MPFPFETEYHYHFKTDAPLTIQKQRTVSRCPGITSAPAADRTFAWFYKSATTEKTPPFTAKTVNRDSIKLKSLGDERRGIYPPRPQGAPMNPLKSLRQRYVELSEPYRLLLQLKAVTGGFSRSLLLECLREAGRSGTPGISEPHSTPCARWGSPTTRTASLRNSSMISV